MTKKNKTTKLALFAGAAALAALAPQVHAQSSDALIDKLVDKGILSSDEAKDLRDETDKDFKTAVAAKTGMPDWVTGYKLYGDFRGRFEQFSADNSSLVDRTRERYRVRFGVAVNMLDNMEAGFRLGSGDQKAANGSTNPSGNPLSSNSTMQDDFSKKMVYIDTAYGKWTPLNSGGWLLAATVGKMDNPFNFTPMVFDPDLTPEGAAVNGSYAINDAHSIAFTGAGYVLDEESGSTHDPFLYGGQVMWNAKWNSKWSSSLGAGALAICSPESLTTANVPYVNQGNSRTSTGGLRYNYTPLIADASVTYTLDSFPLYKGSFPIKLAGEVMNNPGAPDNNNGYWVGVTFGKSGAKKTWDLSYRYESLEADAWYDQLVDDDNGAFYKNAPLAGSSGYYGGTNVKGHLVKLSYSLTDSLTFSTSCFINDLISPQLASAAGEPQSTAIHFFADLMWKF
jgi:hypothetical protein